MKGYDGLKFVNNNFLFIHLQENQASSENLFEFVKLRETN